MSIWRNCLHSSIKRPSFRCFVPGSAWMSSSGDPWAESSQDSVHPHLSAGSSCYGPLKRHGKAVMKRTDKERKNGSEGPEQENRRKHREAAVHLQLPVNIQQAFRSSVIYLTWYHFWRGSCFLLVVANTKPDAFIYYRRLSEKGAIATLAFNSP